jgi:hypothetical protein
MVQIILVYDPARQPFQSQVRSKPSEAILPAITGQTEPGFLSGMSKSCTAIAPFCYERYTVSGKRKKFSVRTSDQMLFNVIAFTLVRLIFIWSAVR